MATPFESYMGKIGAGYGPEFVIDGADLMMLSPVVHQAEVVGSGRYNLGADDTLREAFESLGEDKVAAFHADEADLQIAADIDEMTAPKGSANNTLGIIGAFEDVDADVDADANTDKSLDIADAFADDQKDQKDQITYQVFDGAAQKSTVAATALAASTIEPLEEIAAAALVTAAVPEETVPAAIEGFAPLLGAAPQTDVSALLESPRGSSTDNIYPGDDTLSITSAFA